MITPVPPSRHYESDSVAYRKPSDGRALTDRVNWWRLNGYTVRQMQPKGRWFVLLLEHTTCGCP